MVIAELWLQKTWPRNSLQIVVEAEFIRKDNSHEAARTKWCLHAHLYTQAGVLAYNIDTLDNEADVLKVCRGQDAW